MNPHESPGGGWCGDAHPHPKRFSLNVIGPKIPNGEKLKTIPMLNPEARIG